MQPALLSRRHALAGGVAALGAAGLGTPRVAVAVTKPVLTAQTTEGPYYCDGMPLRADITEGLPGIALDIRFTVLGLDGKPFIGAAVDVWLCDASGVYSGFARQGDDKSTSTVGKTFLRGTLLVEPHAEAEGEVVFRSIYPGWYEGRTTHIHFKVRSGTRAVLTSQFFLPDALSEYLYTQLPTYRRTALRNVLNSTDGIALLAGKTVIGTVREEADRYLASLTLVVDPQANPTVHRPGPGSGPPPGVTAGAGRGGPPPGFGGVPGLKALEGGARVQALVPGSRLR